MVDSHTVSFNGFQEGGAYEYNGIDWNNHDGPDSKYMKITVHLSHDVVIKKIPGKNKKHVTIRTSDVKSARTGPLYDKIVMTQNCVTQERHNMCKRLIEVGGPYDVVWPYGENIKLYCVDGEWTQDEGNTEPPDLFHHWNNENPVGFVGQWVLTFLEYND